MSIDWEKWKKRENREPIAFDFSIFDAALMIVSIGVSVW